MDYVISFFFQDRYNSFVEYCHRVSQSSPDDPLVVCHDAAAYDAQTGRNANCDAFKRKMAMIVRNRPKKLQKLSDSQAIWHILLNNLTVIFIILFKM